MRAVAEIQNGNKQIKKIQKYCEKHEQNLPNLNQNESKQNISNLCVQDKVNSEFDCLEHNNVDF